MEAYAPTQESKMRRPRKRDALARIEAYAPMLESSCGGRRPDKGRKHRRPRKRHALVRIETYVPMLESGTVINAAIMLPRLATCMQSPNLDRNHDSEQPWKFYASGS